MNGRRGSRGESARRCWSSVAIFSAGVLAANSALGAFATQGGFEVNTEGGPYVARDIPWSEQLEIGDQEVSIGGAGNNATVAYAVSILDAAVSASSSAQNALHTPGNYWGGGGGVDKSQFYDDLRFTIPAGSYPDGVFVVASIYVSGSVGASAGANARYSYSVQFGSGSVLVVTEAPAPNVSEFIDLSAEVVSPGTVLNQPVVRLARYSAFVDSYSSTPGEVAQSASSDVSASLVCLEVPAGVTWTSDSAMFYGPDCTADTDSDGVPDSTDNCTLVANTDQRDTNGDAIGNACDADLDGDCAVNFADLAGLKAAFIPNPHNPDADFDGDGFVNFGDLALMKATFFNGDDPGPGPGAPGNACD